MLTVIEGTQLHYEVEGSGVPVFIIHGTNVDYRLMHGCLEPVFSQVNGFMRIYVDIPGMGESVPGAEIKADSDIIRVFMALLNMLIGNDSFLLIGESYGCHLSRGILQRCKDRILGVAFVCPWVPDIPQRIPQKHVCYRDEEFLSTLSKEDADCFGFLAVSETRDAYERFMKDIQPAFALFKADFWKTVERDLIFYHTEVFEKPSLIITARQDTAAGYEAAFALLPEFPRATFAVLDGAGHNAQTERVSVFESLVADFLVRVQAN